MGDIRKLKDFKRGQLDSALMKIGQDVGMDTAEAITAFMRGQLVVTERPQLWKLQKGIVTFSVTSNGLTGKEWIERLKDKGIDIPKGTEYHLLSNEFVPTRGETTKIVILSNLFFMQDDDDADREAVISLAKFHGLRTFHPEVACLFWDMFTVWDLIDMGFKDIDFMHELFSDKDLGCDDRMSYGFVASRINSEPCAYLSANSVVRGQKGFVECINKNLSHGVVFAKI
ncbi:hypothetical protein ISR92_03585 [Patescibacteria group bacterium]|nr:hypothetical protein [Patescibacteria group bacterium]